METKTISIKQLIDKVKRHPMMAELNVEAIIDWVVEFIGLVGLPEIYEEKVAVLTIEDYKAALPDDFVTMIQVRTNTCDPICYQYATDSFHFSKNKIHSMPFTYKIQGGTIYTSNRSGEIEIAYQSIAVDSCGLPLLPDNAKFIRAAEAYVKVKAFTYRYDEGKIPADVLTRAETEYCFAVGACQSEFRLLNLDKVESMMNHAKSFLTKEFAHMRGRAYLGQKEILINHR